MFENAPLSDAACAEPEVKVKAPISTARAAMNWAKRARQTYHDELPKVPQATLR